jgi:AcrR family transcriptional regulator
VSQPADEPCSGRKRVAAEARRAQLIEVALRLFAEQGYDGTATRDIAEAAGVAEGLLFRHFPTKRALLRAVLQEYGPRSQFLLLAPQIAELPVGEALVRLYSQRVDHLWDNRLFVRLVMTESKKPGEAAEEFRGMLAEVSRLTEEFLRARIDRGELRPFDPEVGAAMLGGAVFSFFMRHQALPPETGKPLCRRFVEESVALFLRGALAVGTQGDPPT